MSTYNQLVQPQTSVQGTAGWCLAYIQTVFSAPSGGFPSAFASWQGAVKRGTAHPGDRNLPSNSVPVYFNWQTDGHIVAYIPGSGFLSTPWHGVGHQWFSSIAQIEAALPGTYLGWTEDLNGLRIVSPQAAPAPAAHTITLPQSAGTWHFYAANGPYSLPYAKGTLNPGKYGNLTYAIAGNPAPYVYQINTQDFGLVAVYGAPSTGAIIQ